MCFTVRASLLPNPLKAPGCSFPYTFVASVFRFSSGPWQKIENAENRKNICCLSNNKPKKKRNTSSWKRKTKENHLTLSVTRSHFLWFSIPSQINNDTQKRRPQVAGKTWLALGFPCFSQNKIESGFGIGSLVEAEVGAKGQAKHYKLEHFVALEKWENRGRALFFVIYAKWMRFQWPNK